MDVTALREQTLGSLPPRPIIPCSNLLTDRTANARVLHTLRAHDFPAVNFAEAGFIVASHSVGNFLTFLSTPQMSTPKTSETPFTNAWAWPS